MPAPRQPDKRVARAREMRRDMTQAEKKLWWQLRQLPLANSHFRRQAAIGPYFADFASHKCRVVIEVDGGGHAEARQMATDKRRTAYLASRGYRVLRFWNNEVLKEIEGVMTLIYDAVHRHEPPPTPDVDQKKTPPTPDPSPPRAARVGGGEPRERSAGGEPRGLSADEEGERRA
jgi:very-short-patch-repair endonuclease